MGLYGFKKRFVDYILAGEKTHTIRASRKHGDVPGKTMHLYTGLRQRGPIIQKLASGKVVREKVARLLFRAPCVRVEFIRITEDHRVFIGASFGGEDCKPYGEGQLVRGGFVELTPDERDLLAFRDGFRPPGVLTGVTSTGNCIPHTGAFGEMMRFWSGRLPFEGQIYHWDFDRRVTK